MWRKHLSKQYILFRLSERNSKKNHIQEINQYSAHFDYVEKHLSYWSNVFWGMQLLRSRSESTQHIREKALKNYSHLPPSLQKTILDAACSLFPSGFFKEMINIAESTTFPEHFSLAIQYVLVNNYRLNAVHYYSNLPEKNF